MKIITLNKKLLCFVILFTLSSLGAAYVCEKEIEMRKVALSILFIAGWFWTSAQKPEFFTTKEGAIQGFDPVSYFTENEPKKGNPELGYIYHNATWHFSSTANRDLFKANPEKYTPQFGGYCAFGMSRGYKAETQPGAWTIVDGRLFLNYNENVRKEWNKNQADFISKAFTNWTKVKDQ